MTVAEKKICIIYHNNLISACTAKCPHTGGEMEFGYIDTKGNIVCPVHSYRFSLVSGNNTSGEGYRLTTFPVEKREDGIYIGLVDEISF